jgi:molybdenum cofactor cytidylyltransferase
VTDRIAAVVLAAGAGSRFGGGKLLVSIDGRPLLQHVLDRIADAGLTDVVVVLGDDAAAVEAAIAWRSERRIVNEDPARGLSSSVRLGIEDVARRDDVDAALVVLGDQPALAVSTIRTLLAAPLDDARPIRAPGYEDGGRNPVLIGRAAFPAVDALTGDRGLGPWIAAHPDLVQEVPIGGTNPDVDTRADLVALLEAAWAERVHANNAQVERYREVPDGRDFYAPVTGLFRADPTRTDDPALDALLAHVRPGETWLDIGAGAGRFALPIARALAPSGGRVIALDPSEGMLDALLEVQAEHGVTDVEVVQDRWPPSDGSVDRFRSDVALIAHVSYDIAPIGPFLAAMEAAADRLCIAVLMERQPSSIADVCWPPVWGETRVALPALPEFIELLRAHGRSPAVERILRQPRRFSSRDELSAFLRRQLWVEEGSDADERFLRALAPLVVEHEDGSIGLQGQQPLPIGVVTWVPGRDG